MGGGSAFLLDLLLAGERAFIHEQEGELCKSQSRRKELVLLSCAWHVMSITLPSGGVFDRQVIQPGLH